MSVAEPPPTHDGPCVESLDGDDKPLGYCVTCYQPTGREQTVDPQAVECPHCLAPVGWACRIAGVPILPHHARATAATAREQAPANGC